MNIYDVFGLLAYGIFVTGFMLFLLGYGMLLYGDVKLFSFGLGIMVISYLYLEFTIDKRHIN